jgi:hypothetical protein
MTTTRLLASTVALLGALSALSGDLAAAFEGKVLHVSDSGLKSFVFDAHSRLLRVTFKGGEYLVCSPNTKKKSHQSLHSVL